MRKINNFVQQVEDIEEVETAHLVLPTLYNPHLKAVCKVILFSDKKEEGLCIALQDKIGSHSTENKSYGEYINFSQFVQVTRDYMLASGFKDDKTRIFDLIHCKKLEVDSILDYLLLKEFNLAWYPLVDVKQLLSPIELSFIDRMNQPATFAIAK